VTEAGSAGMRDQKSEIRNQISEVGDAGCTMRDRGYEVCWNDGMLDISIHRINEHAHHKAPRLESSIQYPVSPK